MKLLSKNEAVLQLLRGQILNGVLESGRKYSATEVAVQLEVSRTPVNYAIRMLEEQGLITVYPNVGFSVKPLNWDRAEELMCIKTQLEKLALQRMAQRASDDEILALKELNSLIRRAVEQADEATYVTNTREYHTRQCEAGQAPLCLDYLERYWDYEGWYAVKLAENRAFLLALCDDHDQMMEALLRRDPTGCLTLCDQHLARCLPLLQKNFSAIAPAGETV